MSSVVKKWLGDSCSLKQQTVVLAAFRGCDGVPKNDPSKQFTKNMRSSILINADQGSTFYPESDAMLDSTGKADIDDFFIDCSRGGLDAYPVHWLMHLLQAAEIVGYKCKDKSISEYWLYFYLTGVKALHLNPETEEQLDVRLADKTVRVK